jgi:hypothetical protein
MSLRIHFGYYYLYVVCLFSFMYKNFVGDFAKRFRGGKVSKGKQNWKTLI